MSVTLGTDEAWSFIATGHVGIFTTLRRSGWPISLPVFFVVENGTVLIETPAGSKKVQRIGSDDRSSFLVESGRSWTELRGVELSTRASIASPAETASARELIAQKYAAYQPPASLLPARIVRHYADTTVIKLTSVGAIRSWDNSSIRLQTDSRNA